MAWAAWIALALASADGGDVPRVAWVVADGADVLDEPDDAGFSTGRLSRGRKVVIRRDGPDGWVTIAPPEGAFSYMEEADLEDLGDGRAKVLPRFAPVRPGRDGARVPGPPRVSLRQGTTVRLLDRRPLVERRSGEVKTWIAIAPPREEVRFVRPDALDDRPDESDDEQADPRRDRLTRLQRPDAEAAAVPERPKVAVGPIDPGFFAVAPDGDEGLSQDAADALRGLQERHRQELRKPVATWNLKPIRSAYEQLARRFDGAAERRAIDDRIGRIDRQMRAGQAAARMEALLSRSRARDGGLAEARRGIDENGQKGANVYDANGLLQATSRMVDGRRVHALIGDDGAVVAYLMIPPGLAVKPLVSHRVGVRGIGRYEESLRARLIQVQDLERLDVPATRARPERGP